MVGLHRPQGTPCWCQKWGSSSAEAAEVSLLVQHRAICTGIRSCLTPATHRLLVFLFSSALSGPPSAFKTPAMPELPASLPIWAEEGGGSCCCLASAICLNLRAAGIMRTKD